MGLFRDMRKRQGLTLEAVEVLTGGRVDAATVSRVERGLVKARPDTVVALAGAFHVAARRMAAILASDYETAGGRFPQEVSAS